MRNFTLAALVFCAFLPGASRAQLAVNTSLPIATLVNSLVDNSVKLSNITESCNSNGLNLARGRFTSVGTNLSLSDGLILSSGNALMSIGPNSLTDAGLGNFLSSPSKDPDLQAIVGTTNLYDLCKIEFDLIPSSDTLSISYVFASEEYPEYAPPIYTLGNFNDVFGFFLTGPGYTGSVNFAVLPNGDRVSVNSINASKNAQFLVDNSNGLWLEYDGFSKELVSKIRVIPGQTYHIKLAIADAGDAYYDSGVFIKTGGLTAVPIKLLSLKGRKSGYHNYIEWSSASESNSSQIEVLRSSDGKNFSPIGKVKGSGNSQTRTDYLFKDPKPLYGINYYRIKQIDFNGNHTFSEIISVSNYYADLHVSPVFPNPSTDILNAMVILPEASAIEAEITDLTGKSYLKKTFRVEEGTNIISLETADLPSGVYLVRIFNEDFPGSYQRITR